MGEVGPVKWMIIPFFRDVVAKVDLGHVISLCLPLILMTPFLIWGILQGLPFIYHSGVLPLGSLALSLLLVTHRHRAWCRGITLVGVTSMVLLLWYQDSTMISYLWLLAIPFVASFSLLANLGVGTRLCSVGVIGVTSILLARLGGAVLATGDLGAPPGVPWVVLGNVFAAVGVLLHYHSHLTRLFHATPDKVKATFQLTDREWTVVQEVIKGKTNREIAGELFLEEGTVKNYLGAIYRKMGVKNRFELIRGAGDVYFGWSRPVV